MATPLPPEGRAAFVADVNNYAQQRGIDPRLALWGFTQSKGISPSDTDVYMGLQPGETAAWAVNNGLMPAPQGDYTTSAQVVNPTPATPQTPATPATPQTPATPTTPATAQNPQNATVAEWYRSVLGREPDAGGMSFWTDVLNRNGPEAAGLRPRPDRVPGPSP